MPNMQENHIRLTDAVYRMIEFFPEGEPLRNKIKEKSLGIMENLVLFYGNPVLAVLQKEKISTQILRDIEILKDYLKLGKSQGWMENLNFFIVSKEYDKIYTEIKRKTEPAAGIMQRGAEVLIENPLVIENNKQMAVPISVGLTERQEKILKILKEQGKGQVADFKKVFPNISKRTIRRDLEDLLNKRMVIRAGEWNQVSYKVK